MSRPFSALFATILPLLLLGGCASLSSHEATLTCPDRVEAELDPADLALIDDLLIGLDPRDQEELIQSVDFQALLIELGLPAQHGPGPGAERRQRGFGSGGPVSNIGWDDLNI